MKELNEYQKFLPRMLDALATNALIVHLLEANEEKPDLLPIKKNMGKYMAMIKAFPEASQINMIITSKALQNYLQ